jgi:hypothetical protein
MSLVQCGRYGLLINTLTKKKKPILKCHQTKGTLVQLKDGPPGQSLHLSPQLTAEVVSEWGCSSLSLIETNVQYRTAAPYCAAAPQYCTCGLDVTCP